MEVVIRTAVQLNKMGETGEALIKMARNGDFKGNKYPIVYQFKQGTPGESMDHSQRDVIGSVSNVRLNYRGLVGDVSITTPVKNSINFDGTIDNFVIAKHLHHNSSIQPSTPQPKYVLEHFVVYNKTAKQLAAKAAQSEERVKKMYNAPKEVLDVDPEVGDVLHNNIEKWNQVKDEVINNDDYKSSAVLAETNKEVDTNE